MCIIFNFMININKMADLGIYFGFYYEFQSLYNKRNAKVNKNSLQISQTKWAKLLENLPNKLNIS